MPEEKTCPNCEQTVENGAAYCGNCGYKLTIEQPSPQPTTVVSQVYKNGQAGYTPRPLTPAPATASPVAPTTPAYAVPYTHHKQHWAVMAMACGILGIGAGALIPILGLALGICGIILITSSHKLTHGRLKLAGLIFSILAILVSLGFWVYAVAHDPKLHPVATNSGTSNGVYTVNVSTPCYTLTFNTELNVNNMKGSCTLNAYNGSSFNDSTNVYKVLATQESSVTNSNLDNFAEQAIKNDIAQNLPGFNISNQASTSFAGSPAYYVQAYNSSEDVSAIEEVILHNSSTSSQDNFFVIVHAENGRSSNLNFIKNNWQWND